MATAGVGPRHREGEEKEARAHAPLSPPGLPGQGYPVLISPALTVPQLRPQTRRLPLGGSCIPHPPLDAQALNHNRPPSPRK